MAINFKYKLKEVTPPKDSLIKLDVKRLQSGISLPFNVYVKEGGVIKKIFNKGNILNRIFLDVIEKKGFDHVYIEHSDIKNLEFCLRRDIQKNKKIENLELAFSNYSFKKEKHFQIDRRLIIAGTKVNFSIYNLKNIEFKKIIDATPEKLVEIEPFILDLDGEFVISETDVPLYNSYIKSLQNQIENIQIPDDDKKSIKNIIFKENTKLLVKELLNDPRSGKKIKELSSFVDELITNITEEPASLYDLLTLRGYDFYTYTHSINVGVLSVGLGINLGMNKDSLHKLAIGSILHDIGKTQIPHIILNKQGKLSEIEYIIIKQHVMLGYKLIRENKEISPESSKALLQHHEKLSGRGYPFGLKENQIDLFGRITSIADCYDALTTRRPYKAPLTPYMALCIIKNEKNNYDKNLLIEFIKMLGNVK